MRKFLRLKKRTLIALASVSAFALASVSSAGATITAPNVDVTPLGQGILDALTTNLPTILTVAGVLAGVFFVLRMAKRWFGARAHA